MSSEGRHEIEAARNRLAAARAQASSAAKNVELAKATMQHAESMLQSSTEEVGAAEKGLTEAEKRWEVISIDIDDDVEAAAEGNGNSRKRKKVSLSPETRAGDSNDAQPSAGAEGARQLFNAAPSNNRGSSAHSINTAGDAAARLPDNNETIVVRQGTNQGRAVGAASSASEASNAVDTNTVIVEGAGDRRVNGSYTKVAGRHYGGAPAYVKAELVDGREYVIFRRSGYWYIGFGGVNEYPHRKLYRSSVCRISFDDDPVRATWMSGPHEGFQPIPSVRWLGVPSNGGVRASGVSTGTTRDTITTQHASVDSGATVPSNGDDSALNTAGGGGDEVVVVEQAAQRPASRASQGQQQQQRSFQLNPEMRNALRQAVLSAIRHPDGQVDPALLGRAVDEGLPRQAVLNAVAVARQKDRENREEQRRQREMQQRPQARQRETQDQREEGSGPGMLLPKKHTDALYTRIKRLVSSWAEEEQMDGKNVFYWNIMSPTNMATVAAKVPMRVLDLSDCCIPENIQTQYGRRLLDGIHEYLSEQNLEQVILKEKNIRFVMSEASSSRAKAAAALRESSGDFISAINSLA